MQFVHVNLLCVALSAYIAGHTTSDFSRALNAFACLGNVVIVAVHLAK